MNAYQRTILLLTAAMVAAIAQPADTGRYLKDVRQLASPEMQGRGAGTQGISKAADYIETTFRAVGLEPAGTSRSYRQGFEVITGASPGKRNGLQISGGRTLQFDTDYRPLSFSSSGEASGPVVFAGFGITAPEFGHDDYKTLDVQGKIVVVQRYEPRSFRKDSRAWTHHASLAAKANNARNRGAKALILMNGDAGPNRRDALIRFGTVAGPDDVGILMVHVKNAIGEEWRKSAGVEVSVRVDIERQKAQVENIAAYLPGRTAEYVVIGAHCDHLGFGNESSLAPSQIGKVHPGADDNASGTAGLLELARVLSTRRGELHRGVLFVAFAGEEIGLLGSAHWTDNPTKPLKNAVAMLNLDMIGRVNGSKLYIGGTGTGSTFEPMLKDIGSRYRFQIEEAKEGFSSSDHTSFAAKSIPVLFFFSGLHSDYHKPSDAWEKIDAKASSQVVNLVHDVALHLATGSERPKFVRVQTKSRAGGNTPSTGSGYGPYFGSIPDFAPVPKGVRFSDVRAGSPADRAGLRPGDIMIAFGDKPILNLYDFTYALRGSKPGDVVTVRVLRDGEEISAKVTLEARQ